MPERSLPGAGGESGESGGGRLDDSSVLLRRRCSGASKWLLVCLSGGPGVSSELQMIIYCFSFISLIGTLLLFHEAQFFFFLERSVRVVFKG